MLNYYTKKDFVAMNKTKSIFFNNYLAKSLICYKLAISTLLSRHKAFTQTFVPASINPNPKKRVELIAMLCI